MVWESLCAIFIIKKKIYKKNPLNRIDCFTYVKKILLLKYIVVCVHFNMNTQKAQF